MIKFKKLLTLEKNPVINISHCNTVENWYDEEKGLRTRILEMGGRFFLHKEDRSGLVSCIEVAVEWRIRADRIRFAWTPDGRHTCLVESGGVRPLYEIFRLDIEQIQPGDSCEYMGMKLTYVDPTHIRLNATVIPVVEDSEFVYGLRKKWIRAQNGAAGLFRFLEQMAEEHRVFGTYPVLSDAWEKIFDFYQARKKEVAAA